MPITDGVLITYKGYTDRKDAQSSIPGQFPMAIVRDYYHELREIVKEMEKETLNEWDKRMKAIVKRMDAPADDLESILDKLRTKHQITTEEAESIATDMVKKTRKFSINQVDDQIEAIAGVRPTLRHPRMSNAIQTTIKENVRLIKTIPEKYHDEVERVVHQGVLEGVSTSKIRDNIVDAGRKTTNNGMLIARDQTGNVMSTITKERQTQAGVEHYIWRDSGDNRVRSTHESFDGERYSWKEGSPEGHPGEPIQCRCIAIPDEEEVLNNFGQGETPSPIPTLEPQGEQIKEPEYENSEIWANDLSDKEKNAFETYTSPSGKYEQIRDAQKGINTNETYKELAQTIEDAMYKAPNYDDVTYRGMKKLPENVYEMMLDKDEIVFNTFQSTSKELNRAKSFASPFSEISRDNRSIIFKIKGNTGVEIEDVSVLPGEKEVLFKNGARFKNNGQIDYTVIKGEQVPIVELEEITTGG